MFGQLYDLLARRQRLRRSLTDALLDGRAAFAGSITRAAVISALGRELVIGERPTARRPPICP